MTTAVGCMELGRLLERGLSRDVKRVEVDTSHFGPLWVVFHMMDGARLVITASPSGGYEGEDASASIDVCRVPANLCVCVEGILTQVCDRVAGKVNDKHTWRGCQKHAGALLRTYVDTTPDFGPDGLGAYFEPTTEQVDRHELAGYVTFCMADYRIRLDFVAVPTGEVIIPLTAITRMAVKVVEA